MAFAKVARLADPAKPASLHFNGMVQLTRSQTATVAAALDALFPKYGSRARIALALGVKLSAVQKLMMRKASTELKRDHFDDIVAKVRIDTTGWDINRGY